MVVPTQPKLFHRMRQTRADLPATVRPDLIVVVTVDGEGDVPLVAILLRIQLFLNQFLKYSTRSPTKNLDLQWRPLFFEQMKKGTMQREEPKLAPAMPT